MKIYQVLCRGIYSNKLTLIETKDFEQYHAWIKGFHDGLYDNVILLDSNVYNVSCDL